MTLTPLAHGTTIHHERKLTMKHIKKVIIIGGGVSGLAAGGLLARRGLNVKLLEANNKLGGCCASTEIDGYSFNDGAIFLGMPSLLDHTFVQLGLVRTSLLPICKITKNMTTLLPNGTAVTIGEASDVVIRSKKGSGDNARLQTELVRMLQKWKPILRLFEEEIIPQSLSLSRLLIGGWPYLLQLRGTLASELYRLFRDDAVRAAMSGVLLYAGVPPEKAPVLSILALVSILSAGLFLPEGGMGRIPHALSQGMRRYGGEICLDSKVQRIVVRNGKVCGVEVKGQGLVEADAVISTVSAMATFRWLMQPEEVHPSTRRKLQSASLSHKALSLQLGLTNRIDVESHSMNVLPMMEEHYKFFKPDREDNSWLAYAVPTVTMPELASRGGSIVELYTPIPQNQPADAWSEQQKEEVATSALVSLSRYHYLDVKVKRVRSPKDFQTEMHLYGGALYGLSPATSPLKQFSHTSPLPGLFLAGQTTYPGFGVGPASISGILSAKALLKSDT
jgi:phytoene desaturase